jgi:hypothetical protein
MSLRNRKPVGCPARSPAIIDGGIVRMSLSGGLEYRSARNQKGNGALVEILDLCNPSREAFE